MQTALPGLAPDPYRLEPLRPSYRKLVRQLEQAARATGVPVATLTGEHLANHAAERNWSAATLATLTRVASAHGLPVAPTSGPAPVQRPDGLLLARYTDTGPHHPYSQQRTAALAALSWRLAAPLAFWRRLTFADLAFNGSVIDVAGYRVTGAVGAVRVWQQTARTLRPNTPDDRIPFLARLDGTLTPAGARTIEHDWAAWMDGITFDRWRAWATDAGAPAVGRGEHRWRHL